MMQIGSITPMAVGAQPHQVGQPGQGNVVRERQSPMRDTLPHPVEKRVSAEDFLKKVAALTDGGQHSVRFEMDQDVNMMVVKIFDSSSNELLQQIPAESLLGTTKALQEYRRGLLVDDQS
ncbi:MAG: flagellar protein FlaG [Desulfobulbaceae bacterium]|nr:flagellar protein FlaG [Desulfobulbaceae bacterium]